MLALKKKKKKKVFNRYILLVLAMLLVFGSLGARLYVLQISDGDSYSQSASSKATKEIGETAPRGKITDKSGTELATNVQSYDITYTETDENDKKFFSTMSEVFKILDENGETQTDSFALKIDPYSYEFNTTDQKSVQTLQLRFLRDRGFQDKILKKYFSSKKESKLSSSEKKELDSLLLKLTPKQVFDQLVANYGIKDGLTKIKGNCTIQNERRYMIVKDTMKMQSYSGYKAVTIASNVKKNTALIFWQKLSALPGINVSIVPLRTYPYGQLGSAVLGYISKISPDDQETYEEKGYDVSTDYVGASGIEKAFENRLRGKDGAKVVKVDNQGRIINEMASRASSPGQDVQLTIDKNIQYAADKALDTTMEEIRKTGTIDGENVTNATRGAVVVIDVKTGGILALSSRPGFDPNIFSNPNGLSSDDIKKYFDPDYLQLAKNAGITDQSKIDMMFPIDKSISGNTTKRKDFYDFFPKYLYNYATMSLIPPGSTFKPVTAVAGLETGVVTRDYTVNDTDSFDYGGGHIITFKGEAANGNISMVEALAKSSNPYFMTVGKLLNQAHGTDILAQYAWKFGLGAKPGSSKTNTGIEIQENFGQVYNSESQKNISANTFLYKIEQNLYSGKDADNGASFPQVDLYDRITDSSQVKSIKQQIKDNIKNSVKNGDKSFSSTQYNTLFQQLIGADSFYKDKSITPSQISAVTNDIYYQAISQGYAQLKGPYNMYIASIGQGMDNFTPLQLADYIATLANGGTRYKLHLVDKITDADGKVVSETKPEVLDKVDMKPSTLETIKEGMNAVTSAGDGGTAAAALGDFPIKSGGKTGSATYNQDLQSKIGRSSYGWYVGFAPYDNPEIAVAAVVFDGGYGSYAANVVRGVYEAYFKDQLDKMGYTYKYDVTAKP